MTRLHQLADVHGQSPWLDNLARAYLTSGELERFRDRGVRGLTSNPTIFQKAIQGSADYDEQFRGLVGDGGSIVDGYWEMVTADIHGACDVFAPVHDATGGLDGYVSVEVDPGLAHDGPGTARAARELHERLARPNLMVKIPATAEGLPAIRQMIAEGRSINVTLIFSLDRYQQVMEAYLEGLEALAADPAADLSGVASVASFFVSRVDTEVDRRLEALGTEAALGLRGQAALAQARLAYRRFGEVFSGARWEALVARGARVQRPLWASTGTKNPAYSDVLYVDGLIGPHTVNTLPEATLEAFAEHGTLARTVDADPATTDATWARLDEVGIDMDD
ncbi:MAG: transaldolase, partial [Ilumatobacteraceae bacterium]|nr:transaldolase [Ilumatobacteraceae bacterium]